MPSHRPDPLRVRDLFEQLLDLTPERRSVFLDSECAGDAALRARLEDLMGPAGKREYIGVLRLLEQHDQKDVERAVERAMAHGVIGKDAIAQCLLAGDEFTPPVFTLDGREHLAKVRVDTTDASAYEALRVGGGAQ